MGGVSTSVYSDFSLRMHVYTRTHAHTRTRISLLLFLVISRYECAHTHKCLLVYMCVNIYVCVYLCVHVYLCVYARAHLNHLARTLSLSHPGKVNSKFSLTPAVSVSFSIFHARPFSTHGLVEY